MSKKRVAILLTIAIAFSALVAEAQTKKIPRIGWLSVRHGPRINPFFRQGLRELGWIEGENIGIETRFAKERYDQLPKLAAELVQLKVDVIVTADSPVIRAAKQATRTIPIVMGVSGDPAAMGYVESLARPGGNITGLSLGRIDGKRLQILKESAPGVSHVAMFDPRRRGDWKKQQSVSRALGIELDVVRVENPDDLESAFKSTQEKRVNGLLVVPGPQTNFHRHRIIEFASHNQLPAIYGTTAYVRDGGLMSYGPKLDVMFRRAAYYVDRILRGAKPSDLPVERAMAAEFAINLKAAKEIGLKIPPEVLQRADQVIR